ncbi:enoyl-CoA hydratase/isomerase family protein [Microbacterium sp. SORGH_AS_0888]|uniref:enoyl-CoA hydratase/isomerase family protein n=1 Tax=Microbacterium sp. SORGH_AS_0888 TaxID=3041791 RepID=UPI0027861A80|nr:enoyl-CoA hydratase-related protein [Microbacterium sp. SORGH_AS_0888]MDQ1131002.1 E-phenylitaconyl-CoA hydratase [Microbacterium sp. SORGH_AS_0888]
MTEQEWSIDVAELGLTDVVRDPRGIATARKGHVAVLLLDRPHRGNAFDTAMISALEEAWSMFAADPGVRSVVLASSTARLFATGRDVTELAGLALPSPRETHAHDFAITARRAGVWLPVVAAVEGLVMGAGLHFVLDSDLVVASSSAQFGDSHVNIGLAAGIEVVGLTERVGLGDALYLTLLGKDARMDAAWAQRAGLVQEVVADGDAVSRALSLAERIAANSPAAVARTLQAGWETVSNPAGARAFAWQLIQRQLLHPDAVEGPAAWVEKRTPRWQ